MDLEFSDAKFLPLDVDNIMILELV